MCVHIRWGGSRETWRRSRRGADWSVPGGRTRWPSLAFDSSGQCPGTRMSHFFFFPGPFCFSFRLLSDTLRLKRRLESVKSDRRREGKQDVVCAKEI